MTDLYDLIDKQTEAIRRLKAEKETIIGALRKLVNAWGKDQDTFEVGPWIRGLNEARSEAEELLRLIDLAKPYT